MANPYANLTAQDFLTALQSLMPQGYAWTRDPNATLTAVLQALADGEGSFHTDLSRFSENESDPRLTVTMLPDWERAFGLPDPCTPAGQTLEQRHNSLVARITDNGGESRQDFIDLAAALGFDITITEFRPFTCISHVTEPVCDDTWRFAWQVNAPLNTVFEFTCESGCDEPLRSWGNDELECAIRLRNRASRQVLFSYN